MKMLLATVFVAQIPPFGVTRAVWVSAFTVTDKWRIISLGCRVTLEKRQR